VCDSKQQQQQQQPPPQQQHQKLTIEGILFETKGN